MAERRAGGRERPAGEVRIEMPERPESGQDCYSLFPARRRRGRGRKSPEKLQLEFSVGRGEPEPRYRLLSRPGPGAAEAKQKSWTPSAENGKSFAEVAKKGPDTAQWSQAVKQQSAVKEGPGLNSETVGPPGWTGQQARLDQAGPGGTRVPTNRQAANTERLRALELIYGPETARTKLAQHNTARKTLGRGRGAPSPSSSAVMDRPVVNKISASTYSQIGRSDDESKYVMSGAGSGVATSAAAPPTHELEVEFKEPELHLSSSSDDFEVEFSPAAARPAGKNVVNKISALTFQQIGRTSESESYVMKPKSWSAVVGQGVAAPTPQVQSSPSAEQSKPLGEPTPHDKIRAKMKEGLELTEKEREILREKRRERRKREKINKKKDKEDAMRSEMLKPQNTKLKFISSSVLEQVKTDRGTNSKEGKGGAGQAGGKGIRFQDEEYPDLGTAKPRQGKFLTVEIRDEAGRLTSDRESNSDWETEEDSELRSAPDSLTAELNTVSDATVEVVSSSVPLSYSSILKSAKKPAIKQSEKIPSTSKEVKVEIKQDDEKNPEKKKVKKKDPVVFDLSAALTVKKPQSKKVTAVVAGKLKKDVKPTVNVRNQLDSSAPTKKRGKEREGGKKKKKTLLKKIILADRAKKKQAREDAEKRREDRIKAGVTLKPIPIKDEYEEDNSKVGSDKIEELKSESTEIIPAECLAFKLEKTLTDINSKKTNVIPSSFKNSDKLEELKSEPTEIKTVEKDFDDIKADEVSDKDSKVKSNEEKIELVEETFEEKALKSIHSRKFRSYCFQLLSPALDDSISSLMADLIRFQDKQYAKDPVKAKAKRRFVVGLREAAKFLKVKKVRLY